MELSSICWHSLFRIHIFPFVRVPSFNGVSMSAFTTKHGDLAPDPPGANGRGCPGNCGELATRVSSCTKDQEGSLWNHGGVVSSQQQEERFLDEISKNMCVCVCFFFVEGGGGKHQSNNQNLPNKSYSWVVCFRWKGIDDDNLLVILWGLSTKWASRNPYVEANSWKSWVNFLDVSCSFGIADFL